MLSLNSLFNNLLFSNKYWIIRHLLFWFIMYSDEVLAFTGLTEREFKLNFFIIQIIPDLMLVYINLYILIPNFLNRKQLPTYVFFTALTISFALFVNYFIITFFSPDVDDIVVALFRSFLLTMGVLGTAISIKIIKRSLNSQQKLRQLERINYETEVNYLKMQVNPHFLFNTLNNIYVQSKKYPATVSDSIMKLSDLMRYQIYDGSKKTALLVDELKFTMDYLDLEKMRKDNLIVKSKIDVSQPGLEISPLLLIPLVENAIKHSGPSNDGVTYIDMYCSTHQGEIIFDISNTISSKIEKAPGIGLKNLRRRLKILYPDKHLLSINQTNELFSASLRINTND